MKWCSKWKIHLHPDKTEAMIFSRKRTPTNLNDIMVGTSLLKFVNNHKHLGMILTSKCDWSLHVQKLVEKTGPILGTMKMLKYKLPRHILEKCYKSYILPVLEYGNVIYSNALQIDLQSLDNFKMKLPELSVGQNVEQVLLN